MGLLMQIWFPVLAWAAEFRSKLGIREVCTDRVAPDWLLRHLHIANPR